MRHHEQTCRRFSEPRPRTRHRSLGMTPTKGMLCCFPAFSPCLCKNCMPPNRVRQRFNCGLQVIRCSWFFRESNWYRTWCNVMLGSRELAVPSLPHAETRRPTFNTTRSRSKQAQLCFKTRLSTTSSPVNGLHANHTSLDPLEHASAWNFDGSD